MMDLIDRLESDYPQGYDYKILRQAAQVIRGNQMPTDFLMNRLENDYPRGYDYKILRQAAAKIRELVEPWFHVYT